MVRPLWLLPLQEQQVTSQASQLAAPCNGAVPPLNLAQPLLLLAAHLFSCTTAATFAYLCCNCTFDKTSQGVRDLAQQHASRQPADPRLSKRTQQEWLAVAPAQWYMLSTRLDAGAALLGCAPARVLHSFSATHAGKKYACTFTAVPTMMEHLYSMVVR